MRADLCMKFVKDMYDVCQLKNKRMHLKNIPLFL